jgi:uncharacterized protein
MQFSKNIIRYGLFAGIFAIFLSISGLVGLYIDYLWFLNLGFLKIFSTSLYAKILAFAAATLFFLIFGSINLWIASRYIKSKLFLKAGIILIVIIAVIQGFSISSNWMIILQYFNQVPFGLEDPILGKDVSFYIFSLPFQFLLWKYLLLMVLTTIMITVIYYFQNLIRLVFTPNIDPNTNITYSNIDPKKEIAKIGNGPLKHLAILLSFFFILLAVWHYLSRFSMMYSERGIVVGAGYADVFVFLPIASILVIVSLLIALSLYVWIFFQKKSSIRGLKVIAVILTLYFFAIIVGEGMIPSLVQNFKVSPNEINLEKPFIENNIEFTKIAYGLDSIEERNFDVTEKISVDTIKRSEGTINNIRILDYRPLTQTYKQTQEIRLYYDLSSIDIDRYMIDGKYTQVMLAPRELDQTQIAENAKTWVNLHMIYSHGFGVVVSPVNEVTDEGLPNYLVKDIPPTYATKDDSLKIDQPRIYYGEKDNKYILVNTKTQEFDFPKGNTNEYIQYDGNGGIPLDSFYKKLAMAVGFGDIKILLSTDITPESRILFRRNIQNMIHKITPFMILDQDPYMVINKGKLYWIQDAYTAATNFPYSQKAGKINYIRNSVKIIVDAYNGEVIYYIIDDKDPLIQVYSKIFPEQFRAFDDFPLKDNIRYPEDLFKVQSKIYSTYHMNDPTVFYNKEDAWEIPSEIYGTGQEIKVEPYYIIINLPGEKEEEFVLMTTFTPIKKDNMNSWMAARSDGENYGKLIVFRFPKDKLVYGPLQIEARIDQDSEISSQLTLWSQQGSRVTRGNLLVIPIENSLLYIEPLYIQAETGQLPELKRIIISDGNKVVMEPSLDIAMRKLFNVDTFSNKNESNEFKSIEELLVQANDHYKIILDAMEKRNWQKFGENFDALGNVLKRSVSNLE